MNDPGRGDCPRCGEPVVPTDQFCEACGGELHVQRASTADRLDGDRPGPCRSCGQDLDPADPDQSGDRFCPECGTLVDDGTDRVEIDLAALAGVSDRGLVHARNEDAMAVGVRTASADVPGKLAAVVCDGVSSVERPQLASRAAATGALDTLLAARGADVDARTHMEAAVSAAAAAVATLPYDSARGAPSCTFVAALVNTEPGTEPTITVAWVGDSRAYWLARPGEEHSALLTADHSWAAEIVAMGELDAAGAAADPRAHAITRWLGADASDAPTVTALSPTGPGLLLLCSDGLWNYLPDAAALASAAYAAGSTAIDIATELTAYALDCGGRDNITVVVIPIGLEDRA